MGQIAKNSMDKLKKEGRIAKVYRLHHEGISISHNYGTPF
jgi:hypothetical protein